MKLSLLFVIGSAICASVAYAASISTTSVTTFSIFNGQEKSCSMTSSGALVSCDSSVGGIHAAGSASSSASFGNASVFAESVGEGAGGQTQGREPVSMSFSS